MLRVVGYYVLDGDGLREGSSASGCQEVERVGEDNQTADGDATKLFYDGEV
jgi:hypothetical protein